MITLDILSSLVGQPIQKSGSQLHVTVLKDQFTVLINRLVTENKLSLVLLYGTDDRSVSKSFGVHVILSLPDTHEWFVVSSDLPEHDPHYESLTKTLMATHWYERYLMDMFGIVPDGHPDLRRLVHHENVPLNTHPLRKDFAWNTKMDHADVPYPMHHVEGEGIYEIPVGPIHAGIIEPGHFRFNVAGERIITLEGKLFFTHKGVEKLLEEKTPKDALVFVERISGDAAASHALAFCQAIEALAPNQSVPERAQYLRALVGELERLTMHIHDLSNIAGMGTGYTLMAAQGFRIKERMMRLSEKLLGNRFWRGMITVGGCQIDFTNEHLAEVAETVESVVKEMNNFLELALRSSGLRERLETTGTLLQDTAIAYGALGLPARASGLDYDVRRDHPYAAYPQLTFDVPVKKYGDVLARFLLRCKELDISWSLIRQILEQMKPGSICVSLDLKDGLGIGAVESWRGQILTCVYLEQGKIKRCVPRDPSFCNWALFGELGPGNIVPDFPLCNKSLNLSYSGNDL